MRDIDNIENWYKEELNNYHVEPNKNVWDSLSEELDASAPLTEENIGEWYKKEVIKLEERPDYTVWEKLSTRLDTTNVWDKLVISLNRYDQFIWWRNIVFRGSSILLLLFGGYLAFDNYTNEKYVMTDNTIDSTTKKITNNNVSTALNKGAGNTINSSKTASFSNENNVINKKSLHSSFVNNSSLRNNLSTEEKIRRIVKKTKKNIVVNNSSNNKKERYTYASKENITKHSSIAIEDLNSLKTDNGKRSIYTTTNHNGLTERDISHLYTSSDFLVKKDNNKIIFNGKRFSSHFKFGVYARRIYLGFNAGFKKQSMITKLKKTTLLGKYKQTHLLDFGSNLGTTIGFIVSDNFNLETNININSTSGYKRTFNLEEVSYRESLNLNYTSISLLAKKMNNKSTFDNKIYSTNLIGGIYASYLRSATSDIKGVSNSVDEYNKTDFGIVLGIEQDRYLTKTLVITPGLRYNQGLKNIATKNSSFESSRNVSFEFNLGFKYIFLKKR